MSEHAHDSHDDHHGLGHVLPVKMLAGVLAALIGLTVLTVITGTTYLYGFDLAVALLIATVKAVLVATIFMHLAWDRRFHAFAFVGSVLFVGVFLAYTMADTREYQGDIRRLSIDDAQNSVFAEPLPDPRPSSHGHGDDHGGEAGGHAGEGGGEAGSGDGGGDGGH